MYYRSDVVNPGASLHQQPDRVGVVALRGHVQRTETTARAHWHRRTTWQQQLDDVIMTASGGTVKSSQPVLYNGTKKHDQFFARCYEFFFPFKQLLSFQCRSNCRLVSITQV